ncbi:MAG: helix-turn-helix domain-containing protein, partial [Rhodoferax sp.]|nr:helix-turn-helix domain-containing protein [Rhodoferax sp.]
LNPGRCVHVAPALLVRLRQHAWPGNLRQYANALRTASAMLEPHEACIDWVHLSDDVQEDVALAAQDSAFKPTPPVPNLQELSQAAMRQALERNSGNVSQAARQLGISRQTLYRKLQA